MANVWPATQSQLYGELNKLAADGLIEVGDIGPRGRKEYRVTDAGRAELVRWMINPQDDPPYRSASLLRVFLLGEIPLNRRASTSSEFAGHADSELNRLQAVARRTGSVGGRRRRVLRGCGAGVRTRCRADGGRPWARSLVRALDERQKL